MPLKERSLEDRMYELSVIIQDTWTQLKMKDSDKMAMQIRHLRTTVDILRDLSNKLDGRNPCHKAARQIEAVIIKAQAELNSQLVRLSFKDYTIVCPKCFRPNFFDTLDLHRVCQHCEYDLD